MELPTRGPGRTNRRRCLTEVVLGGATIVLPLGVPSSRIRVSLKGDLP